MVAKNNASNRIHVFKRGVGWAVKKEGAQKALKIYPTRDEAVEGARRINQYRSALIVHNRDGSILKWEEAK